MTNEIIIASISAIIGAVAGGITTLILDKRKEIREDKREKEKEKKRVYEKRPQLRVVEYKEYLSRPGHKLKKDCDINLFMTKMQNVSVESNVITAHYNEKFFNKEEWCCVIYEFMNEGKTDIQNIRPICTYKKDTMLCSVDEANLILKHGLLKYSTLFDRKIRAGESFTMRVCYHKDCIVAGMISAIMVMGMEDCNNRFWEQPLFTPNEKIYDTLVNNQYER